MQRMSSCRAEEARISEEKWSQGFGSICMQSRWLAANSNQKQKTLNTHPTNHLWVDGWMRLWIFFLLNGFCGGPTNNDAFIKFNGAHGTAKNKQSTWGGATSLKRKENLGAMVVSSEIFHHMGDASLEQCEPCLGLGRRVAQRLPSVMSVRLAISRWSLGYPNFRVW